MDPEDVFYKKMGSLENLPKIMERKNRFGGYNDKTLGLCMVGTYGTIFASVFTFIVLYLS